MTATELDTLGIKSYVRGRWENPCFGHHGAYSMSLPRFPCALDKKPLVRDWQNGATNEVPEYQWPLVGVPTGALSGIDVIDIDPRGEPWLQANRERLTTRLHRTPRGFHLLYQYRDGLRCSTGRVAEGVDARADGGFVIWWPRQGYPASDESVMEMPNWLFELAITDQIERAPLRSGIEHLSKRSTFNFTQRQRSEVQVRSYYLLRKVETAAVGNRNNCLFWAACRFGEMVAEGAIAAVVAETLWSRRRVSVGSFVMTGSRGFGRRSCLDCEPVKHVNFQTPDYESDREPRPYRFE